MRCAAVQLEMWRLRNLPGGFPDVVVLALDNIPGPRHAESAALDAIVRDFIGIDIVLTTNWGVADSTRLVTNLAHEHVLVVGPPSRTHGSSIERINASFSAAGSLVANATQVPSHPAHTRATDRSSRSNAFPLIFPILHTLHAGNDATARLFG
jgi:hypothetical protein